MSADCKLVTSKKTISWVLIATILLVVILPAHYHLHHTHNDNFNSAGTADTHIIDLHVLIEPAGQSHHDETTSIATSPDGRIKKISSDPSPFILLTTVLLLLFIFNKQINIQLNSRSTGLKLRNHHFSPLLRAPPGF